MRQACVGRLISQGIPISTGLESQNWAVRVYDYPTAKVSSNPIQDIQDAIDHAPDLNADDFEAIASQSTLPLEVRQAGASNQEWEQYIICGVDKVYLDTNNFEFTVMAENYSSAREIWQAVKENPGLAVISADAVPSRSRFAVSVGRSQFRLEGVHQEDEVMSPIYVEVREPFTGKEMVLTVIGVLKSTSFNYGVYTSQQTLTQDWPIPPTTYLFKLKEGVDAEAMAKAIESEFLVNGMEARSIKETLKEIGETSFTMNSLLQGFMSLGLVVGIAALGVISTRAVVERRHEIGVLRAIGYQRRTVQLSFLLESSIVAFLGIVIGVALALLLSYNVIDFLRGEIEGLEFQIP